MMRHLFSMVLSLLFAALIYVLIGIGSVKVTAGLSQLDDAKARGYTNLAVAVAALAIAGALYAVLVLARLSPLGTVLAGLALAGVAIWAWFAAGSFTDIVPSNIVGVRGAGRAGAGTTTLVLAIPLLLTLFSPRRWRRRANPVAPQPAVGPTVVQPEPVSAGQAYSAQPTYDTPAYGQPPTAQSPYEEPSYAAQPHDTTYGSQLRATEQSWPPPPTSTTTDLFGNPASSDRPDTTRRL
jgi:hypothetical protein